MRKRNFANRSLEYTKDRLDARLREIIGDAFESLDDRYGGIK